MKSENYLNPEHKSEIQSITDEIATLREHRESMKSKFQSIDDEISIDISILVKKRHKLVKKQEYGCES